MLVRISISICSFVKIVVEDYGSVPRYPLKLNKSIIHGTLVLRIEVVTYPLFILMPQIL